MQTRTPPRGAVPPGAVHPKRVVELDGLRAFAILPVIFHHCYPMEGWFGWLAPLGQAGWMGVDLFFVLSGYLISGILLDTVGRPHYYTNFVARRTLRIFPLYYVCLLVFTIATWLGGGPLWRDMRNWGVGWFVAYLGNIRAAWLNAYPPVFLFVPLWSLQVEEQFYLLYPLVVRVFSRQNLRRLLFACIVIAPLLRWLQVLFVPDSSVARYVLMPCRMDALAMGGLVAMLARSPSTAERYRTPLRYGAILMSIAALGLYALVWHLEPDNTIFHPLMSTLGYSLNALASALVLATIVLGPPASVAGLLRWRPLVYTGELAYGLYLLHIPASFVARRSLLPLLGVDIPAHSLFSVPITFLASFVAAGISWKFFETPILRLKDRVTQ